MIQSRSEHSSGGVDTACAAEQYVSAHANRNFRKRLCGAAQDDTSSCNGLWKVVTVKYTKSFILFSVYFQGARGPQTGRAGAHFPRLSRDFNYAPPSRQDHCGALGGRLGLEEAERRRQAQTWDSESAVELL